MLYFVDESGSFVARGESPPPAVFASVVIPETAANEVFHAFGNLSKGLSAAEKDNGEVKGRLMSRASRQLFADFLYAFPDVMVHTTVLDFDSSDDDVLENCRHQMREIIRAQAGNYIFPKMREEVDALGKQVGNLGRGQLAHLFCLAQEIVGATNCSIVNYNAKRHAPCFREFRYEVDAVATRQDIVLRKLMTLWLPAWSISDPVTLIQGIHVPGHPLIDNYSVADGMIDAKKMIVDNIHFVDSKRSAGVQMADIVANSMLQAVRDSADLSDCHAVVVRMLKNGCMPKDNPIGLTALRAERGRARTSKFRRFVAAVLREPGRPHT
ncbi:MAG: DUF3800 domain-containing protein [Phycisphaerae bacterium]|nr:DUF3800 domain-containing protein [Phycisphaerae bacterium]